jgi:hypothetical protein
LEFISQRLKVTTNQIISPFGIAADYCETENFIEVPKKYREEGTNADYVLFVGVENQIKSGGLAFAASCLLGNLPSKLILKTPTRRDQWQELLFLMSTT